MKTYNYSYYKTPISKSNFEANVPKNWIDEIENGEYSWGGYRASEVENEDDIKEEQTFDIHFNDSENSNSKCFKMTKDEAIEYINHNNGTNNSYFADYKGGTVSVVCNETEETVFEIEVK